MSTERNHSRSNIPDFLKKAIDEKQGRLEKWGRMNHFLKEVSLSS
jgi:hypothetical protein